MSTDLTAISIGKTTSEYSRAAAIAGATLLALAAGVSWAGDPEAGTAGFIGATKSRYSQGNEEVLIRNFFGDRRDGVFLDVGAYHWKKLSTTLYMEEKLGWTGIAIDALDGFRGGYEKNRPGTKFFTYIVTDHTGSEETFFMAEGAEGVSSISSDWIQRFFRNFFPGKNSRIREIQVPTIMLDDLLAREGIEHIDLLSMDIEGAERQALAGFDIRKFGPELVCIESSLENRSALLEYFDENGYERITDYDQYDLSNWYFRKKPPTPPSSVEFGDHP